MLVICIPITFKITVKKVKMSEQEILVQSNKVNMMSRLKGVISTDMVHTHRSSKVY